MMRTGQRGERQGRPLWWRGTIIALLTVCCSLLLRDRAALGECSTGICVGNPCTITGTHNLDDNCILDFGTKTVTVSGTLQSALAAVGSSPSMPEPST